MLNRPRKKSALLWLAGLVVWSGNSAAHDSGRREQSTRPQELDCVVEFVEEAVEGVTVSTKDLLQFVSEWAVYAKKHQLALSDPRQFAEWATEREKKLDAARAQEVKVYGEQCRLNQDKLVSEREAMTAFFRNANQQEILAGTEKAFATPLSEMRDLERSLILGGEPYIWLRAKLLATRGAYARENDRRSEKVRKLRDDYDIHVRALSITAKLYPGDEALINEAIEKQEAAHRRWIEAKELLEDHENLSQVKTASFIDGNASSSLAQLRKSGQLDEREVELLERYQPVLEHAEKYRRAFDHLNELSQKNGKNADAFSARRKQEALMVDLIRSMLTHPTAQELNFVMELRRDPEGEWQFARGVVAKPRPLPNAFSILVSPTAVTAGRNTAPILVSVEEIPGQSLWSHPEVSSLQIAPKQNLRCRR